MSAKNLLRLFLSCLFALLWTASAFASESLPTPEPTRLQVRSDLDGDQIPDLAQVSEIDNDYVLSIHLSSKRSWTRLPAYSTRERVIGIEAMDVDGDHDGDIVLLGLNRLQPSGLWLNDGTKGFRSELPWLATTFQKQSNDRLVWLTSENADADPGSLDEPGPDAVVPHYFLPAIIRGEVRILRESREVPFSSPSSNVPLRGPPLSL